MRFLAELRRALPNLYDPAWLRRSPLLTLFGLTDEANPPAALRKRIVEGIQALRPDDDTPPFAPEWRIYHILTYRYIEQSSQCAVAATLGLSIRQLRRQERRAEQVLADALWDAHHLQADAAQWQQSLAAEGQAALAHDLDWLRATQVAEYVRVVDLVRSAVGVVSPLAQRSAVTIAVAAPEDLPLAAGQGAALRQALLTLLTAAIRSAPGGRVQATVGAAEREVQVLVEGIAYGAPLPSQQELAESLAMARQLSELGGGDIIEPTCLAAGCTFAAALVLPSIARATILFVDDNVDALHLFERYLAGSRYHFIGARNAEQALELAARYEPEAIVLDVMLPGVDGWDLLGRLREHPQVGCIPIIVCTILPEEPLARALGAADFLRKPFTREALLAALDRQMDSPSPRSR